jgi:transposase
LRDKIARDSIPEFKGPLYTFANWREEILNYSDCRVINGFPEGKNNRIKTIKRILATDPGCGGRL